MIEIPEISSSLIYSGNGIWHSTSSSSVSYPESGSDMFYMVEDDSFWFNHRNNCIAAAMNRFRPGGTVIDVGGGNGYVTRHLNQHDIEAILLEPGHAAVNNARTRGISTVIHSTFQDADFFDASIPAVGLFDVLEHIEKDMEFLGSIRRKLRPAGRLYATVPACPLLWSDDDIHAQHFRRYTRKQLRSALSDSGFTVEYLTFFFTLLPLAIFTFRSLPHKLGFRSKGIDNKTISKDHKPNPFMRPAIKLLSMELSAIKRGVAIPFGSSLLVVAKA